MSAFIRYVSRGFLLVSSLLCVSSLSIAQPAMTFTRIVNNWPTVELYFKVACDGQPAYPTDKKNFKVFENNIEVDNFTLWCPSPGQRCAISVSLVFDASGGMAGSPNLGMKDAGHAFVDLMDGVIDEASIIWFNTTVTVEASMTTNKTTLHNAVSALPSTGMSAVWDGLYAGVQELVQGGSNSCRAVIAVTDGVDNFGSTHTPDEIITLANANSIRVYTIGLGNVQTGTLETIALLTGGKYYYASSPGNLVSIYEEISTIILMGFLECLITYEASCQDGSLRTVDLQLVEFCHLGSVMKTRTYSAPRDTATYEDCEIALGNVSASLQQDVAVPVTIQSPLPANQIWHSSTFRVHYDESELTFLSMTAPPGTLYEGLQTNVQSGNGQVAVQTFDRVLTQNRDIVCYLNFRPLLSIDTITSPLVFTKWDFTAGCLKPVFKNGSIFIHDGATLHVQPAGPVQLCEGDSLVLTAIDGYTDYLWSTGATGRTLTVSQPGDYWVTAMLNGKHDTSQTVEVTLLAKPTPLIAPSRDTTLCQGETLVVSADSGYVAYEWSNGSTQQQITVDSTGHYFVRVQNAEGCWGESPGINVTILPVPAPVIQGRTDICGNTPSYTYTSSAAPKYRNTWTVTNGQIAGPSDGASVFIRWNMGGGTGTLRLRQIDTLTGCFGEDVIQVAMKIIDTRLSLRNDTTICRGSEVTLAAVAGYDSYLWSTGETGTTITVGDEGEYYVEMVLDNCTAVSDTIHVTVIEGVPTTLTGESVVCEGDTLQYDATPYASASYVWDVIGGTMVSGQGTPTALIRWSQPGLGQIVVISHLGPCMDTDTLSVMVDPNTPPIVTVPDTSLCEGESVSLTAPAGYAAYRWTTGETTRSISVTQSGSYAVTVETSSGCTAVSKTIHIGVHPRPAKPTIIQSGNVLTCTAFAAGYIWYLDGTVIQGETSQTLLITAPGSYAVTVIDWNGCDATSDPMTFTGIGNYAPGLASAFSIAPNPSSGDFTVALEFERPTAFSMRIVNATGQTMYSRTMHEQRTSYHGSISLDGAAAGVYFLILESNKAYDYRKVIVRPY